MLGIPSPQFAAPLDPYVRESLSLTTAQSKAENYIEEFDELDDFCTAAAVDPPSTFDSLLRQAEYSSLGPISPLFRPWVNRALSNHTYGSYGTKYKPVSQKVRPVPTYMPNPEAIVFKPINVGVLPPLTNCPRPLAEFIPTARITSERLERMLKSIPSQFLWPAEIDLMVDVLVRREKAIAFCDNERGVLSRSHYPDYEIPVIEHTPWALTPIRFPAAIIDDVKTMLREQKLAAKYENGYSSYRSRIWAMSKKNGKLRLVLDLQDLNQYVIRDASLPPHPHDFAEECAGHVIYGVADLFSGFDAVTLATKSRDLTTFQAVDEVLRNTCCPQGCTNALQWFQRTSSHAMGEDNPKVARPFVDDLCIKGPRTRYNNETIPGNPGIRRFVYEFCTSFDRILARLIIAGFTASGPKLILATPRVTIVGSSVSEHGWHLEHGMATKILNWPVPRNLTQLRGFLGTAGVARQWIKGFSLIVKPLTLLCRKPEVPDDTFQFSEAALEAMNEIKRRVASPPVLRPIDYDTARHFNRQSPTKTNGEVTVAVDSSVYGTGFILYQQDEIERHPALFGSCTFNKVESRYSQPKLELYGVFRAVRELRHRIWGILFRLEVDAKFLKQMLNEPDLPNAPMTRWIMYISLFDYVLHHVPAAKGISQDGLSRRGGAPEDSDDSDVEEVLDEFMECAGEKAYKSPSHPSSDEYSFPPSSPSYHIHAMLLYDAHRAGYRGHLGYDHNPSSRVINANSFPAAISVLGDFDNTKAMAIDAWEDRFRRAIHKPMEMKTPFDCNETFWNARPAWSSIRQYRNPLSDFRSDGTPAMPPTSPFHASLLRNDHDQVFFGNDFMFRNYPVEKEDTFLLGNELCNLAYFDHRWAYNVHDENTCRRAAEPLPTFELRCVDGVHRLLRLDDESGERTDETREDYPDLPPLDEIYLSCAMHAHGKQFDEYDGLWEDVIGWLKTNERPERLKDDDKGYKAFVKRYRTYFIYESEAGDMLFMAQGTKLPKRVIIDKKRREELVAAAHNRCGHRGRDATWQHLNDRYWWPNMYNDVAWFVRSCNACQMRSRTRFIVPLSPHHTPAMFRVIYCDTIVMPGGFLAHTVEGASGWEEAIFLKHNNGDGWSVIFWKITTRTGCIPLVVCDGGSEFKGAAKIMLEKYGVTMIISSPYYPQGNGIVERRGQTLANTILRCCGDKPSRWADYIDAALFASRTTVSRTTGYTPFFLMYGQEALLPFDMTDRSWYSLDWHKVTSTEDLLVLRTQQIARRNEHLGIATEEAYRTRQKGIDDFMKRNAKRLTSGDFEPGTWVLVHETWLDRQLSNKGALRWAGPYVIHSRHHNNNYHLRELDGTLIREAVPTARLKLFYFRDEFQTMSTCLEPIADYEAEFLFEYIPSYTGPSFGSKWAPHEFEDRTGSCPLSDFLQYQVRFDNLDLVLHRMVPFDRWEHTRETNQDDDGTIHLHFHRQWETIRLRANLVQHIREGLENAPHW